MGIMWDTVWPEFSSDAGATYISCIALVQKNVFFTRDLKIALSRLLEIKYHIYRKSYLLR